MIATVATRPAWVSVRRLGELAAAVLGAAGWGLYASMTVFALAVSRGVMRSAVTFQFDWHVYATGASDLVDRSLYRVPLTGPAAPVDWFNLPPMSALWPLPLLPLPLEIGGYAWQVIGAACLALAAVLTARTLAVAMPLRLSGIALGVLALNPGVLDGIVEGTNNYLVLALVAGFAFAYIRRHDRWAGILLGLAIATKLWPVTLAVLLLRERRWVAARWAAATVGVQAALFLAWLGPDVVPHVLHGLTLTVSTVSCCGMIGPAELRDSYAWWPAWIGPMIGLAFLAAPARGRAGIGLGLLAGLMFVPNLWLHYLPTAALAVVLAVSVANDQLRTPLRPGRSANPRRSP
ncbi:MAG: DUF2029 domain-containing protein [Chloroflexota bacterium]|nr:DUF2029 domain-containing protein [Chloroflexota bacterium]